MSTTTRTVKAELVFRNGKGCPLLNPPMISKSKTVAAVLEFKVTRSTCRKAGLNESDEKMLPMLPKVALCRFKSPKVALNRLKSP